ncbi:tigger transposable element-derived protein 6-like [Haliotis asinina]|uniref:tigger transposable element-derived protein 6-like n=1 Tax=Haliotis asinina TaxID=109174 RepID=UPI00353196FD
MGSRGYIFNADETGLFYKLVPQRTLHLKGDKCHGGKKSKERITVLTAANMSGTEKLKLLVIGKSEKPRCFKNVRSLPVDYRSNGKAWMTSDLFTEWVNKLDQSMRRQNRKVLLLIDNCPAHPRVPNLKNVTVAYLPPNTTSRIQPMDQGIIASLKSNYRKQKMADLISAYDKKEKYEVTLLSAVTNIHRVWSHVTSQCIVNCFRKGGFKLPEENDMDHSELDEDDIPLANLRGMWGEVTDIANVPAEVTLEDFLNADENIVTTERLTDEDIVTAVKKDNETVDSDEDDSETVAEMEVKTTAEAATCLKHEQDYKGLWQ